MSARIASMARYETDVSWEDPFEPRRERRIARRFAAPMRIRIAVHDSKKKCRLICHGNVINVSRAGILVRTKHQVIPGMRVSIAISTKQCEDSVCLPRMFVGSAEVMRVAHDYEDISVVALRFGTELAQNMEFALFTDALQSKTSSHVRV